MAEGILVLSPDQEELKACGRDLASLGYRSFVTADPEKACTLLKSEHPAVLIGDVLALYGGGSQLLRSFRNISPELQIIILTGLATIETAAKALREGALFYLIRPITSNDLKLAVERGLTHWQHLLIKQTYDQQPHQTFDEIIVGTSHALQHVLELAARVARSEANILIFGESGTGKELFAKVIHSCSRRSGGAFIPVDCASLPENLLEAELFGYEKGAFTGAVHTKPGLMELAHCGTLFFDEVAELPMSLQPKLLRALQERRHRRLGGTKIVDFDVRVVSATNRELRDLVSQRRFRQDLFYRLNVVPLHLPPLRTRDNDVALLANHFLKECARRSLSAPRHLAPEVLRLLEDYSWPGNVRELQNVVEYSCAVARSETITLEELPEELQIYNPQVPNIDDAAPALTFKMAKTRWLAKFESGYVTDLLKRHGYNITQAAKAAGVDRKTFYSLLQKYHISSSTYQSGRREDIDSPVVRSDAAFESKKNRQMSNGT